MRTLHFAAVFISAVALTACKSGEEARVPLPATVTGGVMTPGLALPDFTGLVAAAAPSVVNISSTRKSRSAALELPEGAPDMMEEWLRRFFGGIPGLPEGGPRGRRPDPAQESLGSGFIISADGDILTNNHVVAEADEIVVKLSDRRQMVAKVIGADPLSDLALLRIEAKDLPAVKIGDVDQLKVGEWVLAIGSPFGFEHSVTAGIVSAKSRSLASEQYVPFIQTDVAINPGNSGGPLFNLRGEVVGINSQIFSRSGGYMGLSFAIPMDTAMQTVQQLREKGHVARGWLGVIVQEVDRGLAESFGLDKPEGALVAQIAPDSPAEKAGIQPGDIILEYDGKPVSESGALPSLVGRTAPGQTVGMTLLRNGKREHVKITPAELDEAKLGRGRPQKPKGDRGRSGWGLRFRDLTPDERRQLKLEDGGVLVVEVAEGPAAKAGVRPGDVILRLNGKVIESATGLSRSIDDLPKGKTAAVLVVRDGEPRFLAIEAPE